MNMKTGMIIADLTSIAITVMLSPLYIFIYIMLFAKSLLCKDKEVTAKSVLITGPTSGLGQSLAHKYAKTAECLILAGRSSEKLELVAKECKNINAACKIVIRVVDFSDCDLVYQLMKEIASNQEVDLVIACAGIIKSTSKKGEENSYLNECIDVNVKGVMNTILPFIPYMKKRLAGQLCVVVGALGNGTFGSDPVYEGSKNCIRVMLEGYMIELQKYNVGVTIVSPGYMKTKMTEGKHMFLPLEPDAVANGVYDGLQNKQSFICDPAITYGLTSIVKAVPTAVFVAVRSFLSSRKEKCD